MTDVFGAHDDASPPVRGVSVEDLLAGAAYHPPALTEDPAARILGLVPDPSIRFDGPAVKRARQRAGINLPQLVRALSNRGWDVRNSDAFGWETGKSGGIAPALIAAVADIVGVPQNTLATTVRADDPLKAVRATEKFRELAARMSEALSVPLAVAVARLETSAAVAVHRGKAPDVGGALQSLEVLVEELESRR